MITFLHLSDIHFIDRNHGTAFDRDQQIRRALLDDVEQKPADGAAYDGVLITGDIAYAGLPAEYYRAAEFLDELYRRSGTSRKNTYVVPGNHDVDRKFVEPDLPLWAAHTKLRETVEPTQWHGQIYTQLVKDPQRSLLAPLGAYNDFAQGFDCYTGMLPSKETGQPDIPRLAWQKVFDKPLEDGTLIQLHGLNSALISDEGDAAGNLLVSDYQRSHFQNSSNAVNVVMCHHPPEWLMDKADMRKSLRTYAPVALFGHEHDTRITADAKEVRLFAGAVQPSRRDPAGWLPTYHILQLAVETTPAQRNLVVRIHTREYTTDPPMRFRPRRNEKELAVEEHRIELPKLKAMTSTISVASNAVPALDSGVVIAMPAPEPNAPSPAEVAQRELLTFFFQLRTPHRYEAAFKAQLLKDGDDALDPQIMWAEVFRRASDERKFAAFWTAVAAHTPAMKDRTNPFIQDTHAQKHA